MILALLGLVSGLIIEGFRDTLEQLIILTFYMPLLNSTGGNTGSQSATVVLRAIALNELFPKTSSRSYGRVHRERPALCLPWGPRVRRVLLLSNPGRHPAAVPLGRYSDRRFDRPVGAGVWSTFSARLFRS